MFFFATINYLGHTISGAGLKPNQDKVISIINAPGPKNLTELQSYLGLLNYYGKFIPNLSSNLQVLYKLLHKNTKFNWTQESEICVKNTKYFIQNTSNNILDLYDPGKPIVVTCDAIPYGVGAILSHIVEGIEKPVLFASRTLGPC